MSMQLGHFLEGRLVNAGVKHAFGIPGDYVLDFYRLLSNSEDIEIINNTDENHSGFAADAYARVNGIGCVVVTYSVGASKVINAVQCAYAERSPLIVISGAPGVSERNDEMLLHHMVKSFNSQRKLFREITCATVVLDDPVRACYEIDRAFEMLKYYSRPIYIELPRDMVRKTVSYDVYSLGTPVAPKTDEETLEEAIEEVQYRLKKAEKPMILAGVEIARYRLGEKLIKFAERHNIPVATTLLAKSVVNERHELFAGVYGGDMSKPHTKELVEGSDCLFLLGAMLTDMTLCFRPSKFKKPKVVECSVGHLQVKNHTYENVAFQDFCNKLFSLKTDKIFDTIKLSGVELPSRKKVDFEPKDDAKITNARFFEYIDGILDKETALVVDVGDCLFGAADLTVHHSNYFISQAFYTSMGGAIPAALGVQTALPKIRPIVIVGDGAAQMSITEISTLVARGLNPIIFVLNNDGYTTERFIMDGPFNDIQPWNFHSIGQFIEGSCGAIVTKEDHLPLTMKAALDFKGPFVINIIVERDDVSDGLRRLADSLSNRI